MTEETTTIEQSTTQQSTDWRSTLSADYKEKYTEFKTPEDVVKGYDGLVRKLGKNPLVKPADDAPEEDKQKFNAELRKLYGVPESQDAYTFDKSEGLPEEVSALLSDEKIAPYKEAALKAGVTPEGFKAMFEVYQQDLVSSLTSQHEQGMQTHEQAVTELKKEWGDKYDSKVAAAKKIFESNIPESERGVFEAKYGNDPLVIKTFANMAAKSGEEFHDVQPEQNGGSIEDLRLKAKQLNNKAINAKLSMDERRQATKEASTIYQQIAKMQGSR